MEIEERDTRRECSRSWDEGERERVKREEGREERIGMAARRVSPVFTVLTIHFTYHQSASKAKK